MQDRIRLVEIGVIWYRWVLWNLCLMLYLQVKLKLLWVCRQVLVVFQEVFVVRYLVMFVLVLVLSLVLYFWQVCQCIRLVVFILMCVLVMGNCMFWFCFIGWLKIMWLWVQWLVLLMNQWLLLMYLVVIRVCLVLRLLRMQWKFLFFLLIRLLVGIFRLLKNSLLVLWLIMLVIGCMVRFLLMVLCRLMRKIDMFLDLCFILVSGVVCVSRIIRLECWICEIYIFCLLIIQWLFLCMVVVLILVVLVLVVGLVIFIDCRCSLLLVSFGRQKCFCVLLLLCSNVNMLYICLCMVLELLLQWLIFFRIIEVLVRFRLELLYFFGIIVESQLVLVRVLMKVLGKLCCLSMWCQQVVLNLVQRVCMFLWIVFSFLLFGFIGDFLIFVVGWVLGFFQLNFMLLCWVRLVLLLIYILVLLVVSRWLLILNGLGQISGCRL